MLNASWFTRREGFAGTLRLTRNPFHYGLGWYTDVDGKVWDINAIIRDYVCARPKEGEYYSTAMGASREGEYYSTGMGASREGLHTWEPYRVEVV